MQSETTQTLLNAKAAKNLTFAALANTVGCEPDEAVTDVRAYADELLKQDGLSVDSVIRFFRWLRKDVPTDEEIENAAR